jgi:DnaJ-class molecular chaperone
MRSNSYTVVVPRRLIPCLVSAVTPHGQTDPYKTLGVSKTASQDEIKNAYRSLAKKYHPDLNPGKKSAEVKFKEINSAYEQIGTPEERSKFDRGETEEQQFNDQARARSRGYQGGAQGGHQGPFYYQTQEGGGRYSSGFGGEGESGGSFEDLFRAFRQQQQQASQGEDQLYRMDVEFKEAVLGAEREITLNTGKKLRVKIPPGIESGKRLRFKGQGMPGVGGSLAGDAYIEVDVKPSPTFKRNGKNIEIEVPIGVGEAVLGGDVEVPTVEGPVMLHVPAGISSGAKLRIRGKGVPSQGERGDEIVSVRIVLPKENDPELAKLQDAIRTWKSKKENKTGGSHAA